MEPELTKRPAPLSWTCAHVLAWTDAGCIILSEHLEHDVVSWSGRSVEGYTDMAIVIELDEIMEDRGVSLNKLSHRVGITNVNLSRIKTGKVRAVRFSTLAAICDALECQPGDILKNVEP